MAEPASRKATIDVVVLVLTHSPIRNLVGTDALRTVLEVRYRDMVGDGALSLEPLWALLGDQPGFDAAEASPAMAKLKVLERQLGLEVRLPAAMAEVDAATLGDWAASVDIPASLLQGALKGTAAMPAAEAPRKEVSGLIKAAVDSEADDAKTRKKGSRLGERFRGWEIPLAIVGVLGIAVGSYSLHGYACSQAHFRTVQANFGEIPVKEIQRLGDQVGAVLTDSAWLSLPRETREQQLEGVLRGLGDEGVAVIFLMSDKRETLASAKYRAGSTDVSFHFTQ